MLTEELLHTVFNENPGMRTMEDLMHVLDDLARDYRTSKLESSYEICLC